MTWRDQIEALFVQKQFKNTYLTQIFFLNILAD